PHQRRPGAASETRRAIAGGYVLAIWTWAGAGRGGGLCGRTADLRHSAIGHAVFQSAVLLRVAPLPVAPDAMEDGRPFRRRPCYRRFLRGVGARSGQCERGPVDPRPAVSADAADGGGDIAPPAAATSFVVDRGERVPVRSVEH